MIILKKQKATESGNLSLIESVSLWGMAKAGQELVIEQWDMVEGN